MKNIELIKEVTHKHVTKLKHDQTYKRHVRDLKDGTVKQGSIDMSMKPTWKYCPIQKMDDQGRILNLDRRKLNLLGEMSAKESVKEFYTKQQFFDLMSTYNDEYNDLDARVEHLRAVFESKYNEECPKLNIL